MWVPNKRARAQRAEATYSQGNMELGQKIGQHECASKKKGRKKEPGHRELGQHTARATWSWGKKIGKHECKSPQKREKKRARAQRAEATYSQGKPGVDTRNLIHLV